MRRSMRTTKQDERRKAERRTRPAAKPREASARTGQGTVGKAMVDALEDILKWERASERVLKAAQADSTSDLTKN